VLGIVFVLDRDTLEILREEKKSKGAITDVLLTSDGARIAFCTSEGSVILCEYKSLQTLMTINLHYKRPSVRCDFSSDNEFLRILFAPDRITYFSCGEGKEYRDPNQLLHLKWNSTNSIYTWNTQGEKLVYFCFSLLY
jgi:WD40 repeat protein